MSNNATQASDFAAGGVSAPDPTKDEGADAKTPQNSTGAVYVDLEIRMVPFLHMGACACGRDRTTPLTPDLLTHIRAGGEVPTKCSCGRNVIGRRNRVIRTPTPPVVRL